MRRSSLALIAVTLGSLLAADVSAQQQQRRGGGGQPGQGQESDQTRQRRREQTRREFEGGPQAPLSGVRNIGPCPFVKVLYDAGRYVELEGGREAAEAVGFTGEINGIQASCSYVNPGDPIRVNMAVNFALGRGPRAQGDSRSYRWWVAVTERNRQVITREDFELAAEFEGRDRIGMVEQIGEITLPRGTETVSGANYEILVGFEVTPEMAEFNRQGKRFRMYAGAAAATPPPGQAPTAAPTAPPAQPQAPAPAQ